MSENSIHILVIDDEPYVREILARFLEMDGHTVDTAEDGLIGLEKYQAGDFDLVITDIFMPTQGGIETIIKIKEIDPKAKIIAMSGGPRTRQFITIQNRSEREHTLDIAEQLGVLLTMSKPIDHKMLTDAIRTIFQL